MVSYILNLKKYCLIKRKGPQTLPRIKKLLGIIFFKSNFDKLKPKILENKERRKLVWKISILADRGS